LKNITFGAQKNPVNPGTAVVVQAGWVAKTLGPVTQYCLSADDLDMIPCPVPNT
jgi:hypothetical protein